VIGTGDGGRGTGDGVKGVVVWVGIFATGWKMGLGGLFNGMDGDRYDTLAIE
jgi:hypothetical protein